MKRLILVSIASLLLSTYANAEIVWKTPPTRACTSKGGKLENGICKANWQNAKDICRTLGFRLPTIDELRMAITDCGGVVDGSSHNKSYTYYQECYQRRGFSGKFPYLSSTEYNNDSSATWGGSFSPLAVTIRFISRMSFMSYVFVDSNIDFECRGSRF